MSLVISTNRVYQKSNVSTGFQPVVITTEEEAYDIVGRYDWSPIIFKDGHRCTENFMEAVCIAVDIDNTTASRMSMEEFKKEFEGIEYWIFTSRNHDKEKTSGKNHYQKADRFHAVFPLDAPIKSPHEYREFIEAMISKYPAIDSGAKDGARFFFGYEGTKVFSGQGRHLKKPQVVRKDITGSFEIPVSDDAKKAEAFDLLKKAAAGGCFDDREEWISCGMAMKACGYSFEDWMELSWDTERGLISENQKRWDGFRADRHTEGSITRWARMADPGYKVKKYASKPYSHSVDETPHKSVNFLTMPWENWYQPHVEVTKKKDAETGTYYDVHKAKATLENFQAMLKFYGVIIRENLMTRDIEITIPGIKVSEGKAENASHGQLLSLCVLNNFATGNIDTFLVSVAHKNAYHPVRDWFDTLPEWDGNDRINTILNDVLEIEYYEGIEQLPNILVTKWLVSCVAAVYEKSYRGRGVLTFQGEQEIGKTSFFRSIIPKDHFNTWFKDAIQVDTKDKDSVKKAISHWIVELGEIEGMFKKEISALKAFITSDEDLLRLPYERKVEKYPRRTIMCATVNDPNFLNDPTGSSRFWVMATKSIKYVHDIDVGQLWAQAIKLYRDGMPWWLEGEEKKWLAVSNANFYEIDSHAELIKLKFDVEQLRFKECVTKVMLSAEICLILGLKVERKETRAIANALRSLGIKEGYCMNRSKGFVMPPLRLLEEQPYHRKDWRDA